MNQYHKYLKSSQWSDIRDEVLSRDNSTCQQCGSTDNPTVHHKSYAHIFHEQGHLEDLITLCTSCHYKLHNKQLSDKGLKQVANPKLWIKLFKHVEQNTNRLVSYEYEGLVHKALEVQDIANVLGLSLSSTKSFLTTYTNSRHLIKMQIKTGEHSRTEYYVNM